MGELEWDASKTCNGTNEEEVFRAECSATVVQLDTELRQRHGQRALVIEYTGKSQWGFGHTLSTVYLLHNLCYNLQRFCYMRLYDSDLEKMFRYANGMTWEFTEQEKSYYPNETVNVTFNTEVKEMEILLQAYDAIPPDRYRACYGATSIVGPTLCVVRNPHDRLVSDLAWEQRVPFMRPQWLTLDTRRLYTFWHGLAQGKPHLNFYEMGLHLLPQRFFVYPRGNRSLPRTCDCVVAFEKLALLTSRRLNPSFQRNETALNLSLATKRKLWAWYAEDWTLWRRARASKQLCMN